MLQSTTFRTNLTDPLFGKSGCSPTGEHCLKYRPSYEYRLSRSDCNRQTFRGSSKLQNLRTSSRCIQPSHAQKRLCSFQGRGGNRTISLHPDTWTLPWGDKDHGFVIRIIQEGHALSTFFRALVCWATAQAPSTSCDTGKEKVQTSNFTARLIRPDKKLSLSLPPILQTLAIWGNRVAYDILGTRTAAKQTYFRSTLP